MEQDTNVTIETTTDDEAFTFDLSELTEDKTSEEKDEKEETEAQKSTDDEKRDTNAKERDGQEEFLSVDFLGEEKKLSLSDAKTAAQKGLNYDHVKTELDELKNNPLWTAAKKSALAAGLTDEEFAERLLEKLEEREVKKISKERNIDEQAARGVFEEKKASKKELEDLKTKSAKDDEELKTLREFKKKQDIIEAARKEWESFTKTHSEYKKLEDLPEEVKDAVLKNGEELNYAYLKYENAELKRRMQKKEAAQKSPGAAKGATAEEENDDFLKGLLG